MAFTDAETVPIIPNNPGRSSSGDIGDDSGAAESLFRRLVDLGVVLSMDPEGRLAIDAPAGVLSDELVGLVRLHRERLLALVRMVPKVVHLKREPFDVRIDRQSRWGNPFVMRSEAERAGVIAKYRAWVLDQPELLALLPGLAGKRLGCWCSPRPCHGDVLIDLVVDRVLAGGDAAEPLALGPGWVCPWCRMGDRLTPAEPVGLRCVRCDRLAFRWIGADGVERCDWSEPLLIDAPEPGEIKLQAIAPEAKQKRAPVVERAERSLFDAAELSSE